MLPWKALTLKVSLLCSFTNGRWGLVPVITFQDGTLPFINKLAVRMTSFPYWGGDLPMWVLIPMQFAAFARFLLVLCWSSRSLFGDRGGIISGYFHKFGPIADKETSLSMDCRWFFFIVPSWPRTSWHLCIGGHPQLQEPWCWKSHQHSAVGHQILSQFYQGTEDFQRS